MKLNLAKELVALSGPRERDARLLTDTRPATHHDVELNGLAVMIVGLRP
jgi:hypothetical protein